MNNNIYTKVIFLDMDGVINSNQLIRNYLNNLENQGHDYDTCIKLFKEKFHYGKELIFPELAEKIVKICNETNCGIVWSSSWRLLPDYKDINKAKEMFNRNNLPGERLFSYTLGRFGIGYRSSNIRYWIKDHGKKIKKFAIIDDRDDAKYNTSRCKFFQINAEYGITDILTDNIIHWLND